MLQGQSWELTGGQVSKVVVGDSKYVVNLAAMYHSKISVLGMRIIDYGIELKLPDGQLEVVAGSNELDYSELTKRILIARIEQAADEILAAIPDSFEKQINLWDAKKHFKRVFNDMGPLSAALSHANDNKINWKGVVIENNLFFYRSPDTYITKFRGSRYSGTFVSSSVNIMEAADDVCVIIHDLYTNRYTEDRVKSPTVRKILKEFCMKNINDRSEGYLITFADEQERARFYDATAFNSVPVKYLSEIRNQMSSGT